MIKILKFILFLLYLIYWIPSFVLLVLVEWWMPGGLDGHMQELNDATEKLLGMNDSQREIMNLFKGDKELVLKTRYIIDKVGGSYYHGQKGM